MVVKEKAKIYRSMTSTHAAIGGAAFIGFFVIWLLWALVGEAALVWIECHPGTASWIQAIGSIGAIIAAAMIARADHGVREEKDRQSEYREIRWIYLALRKNNVLSSIDAFLYSFEHLYTVLVLNKMHDYPNIRLYQNIRTFIDKLDSTLNSLSDSTRERMFLSSHGREIESLLTFSSDIVEYYKITGEGVGNYSSSSLRMREVSELDDLNDELLSGIEYIKTKSDRIRKNLDEINKLIKDNA